MKYSEIVSTRADFNWPAVNVPSADTDQGIICHYDGKNQNLASRTHGACRDYWLRTRSMHIRSNGWADIGYAYGVCPHGFIFEGRGYGRVQAAAKQTPGKLPHGNDRWVNVTFMSGPNEMPTPQQISAFRALRSHLMDTKNLGASIKSHRDFTATDCPGDIIDKLVDSGALATYKPPTDDLAKKLPVVDHNGSDLEDTVKALQRDAGITADGIIGPITWSKLLRR